MKTLIILLLPCGVCFGDCTVEDKQMFKTLDQAVAYVKTYEGDKRLEEFFILRTKRFLEDSFIDYTVKVTLRCKP